MRDSTSSPQSSEGSYIAVSGNTASGKSTLVTAIVAELARSGRNPVGINERDFHPRYLKLMFADPKDFAFSVQLQFLLSRHQILLRNLVQLNKLVVMERSHLDDDLFVREHLDQENISNEQYELYASLANQLHSRIPDPDILVLLNARPEVSVERLRLAEQDRERPREFPDEASKVGWVNRWYHLYEQLHATFRSQQRAGQALHNTKILNLDDTLTPEEAAKEVVKFV